MDNRDQNDDRLLRYLVSDTGRKAPEGFTERIMTRVTLEKIARNRIGESPVNTRILAGAISLVVIAAVVLSLLPDGELTVLMKSAAKSLGGYLRLPVELPLKTGMADIEIPAMFAYLSLSVLMLILLDRFLSRLFTRGKSNRN